jgi:hypothetical protein
MKTKHPLYETWRSMRYRCKNPNNSDYKNYGAKGISVCEEWDKSFDAFVSDMGSKPEGYSLDRINPLGNYEKNNCRWASKCKQADNKASTIMLPYAGVVKTLTEWSRLLDMHRQTIYDRVFRLNWSIEDALTTPSERRSNEF